MSNTFESNIRIKVIGVGGAGGNIITQLSLENLPNVESVIMNTDLQDLSTRPASIEKLQLGPQATGGFGAGSDPTIGKLAMEESAASIESIINNQDIVFTIFGLGGGTGTGAGPEIARIAKEKGALSIVIATLPFAYEGNKKKNISKEAIEKIKTFCDSYTLFSNEKLMMQKQQESIGDSYNEIDNQIRKSITTIVNIITNPGKINIDFADIRTVLKNSGQTIIGLGQGTGHSAAEDAVVDATENPLFEGTLSGCTKAIVNVMTSPSTTLSVTNKVVSQLKSLSLQQDIEVITGLTLIESLGDEVNVSIIATGFDSSYDLEETYEQQIEVEKINNTKIKSEEFETVKIESEELDFLDDSLLSGNFKKDINLSKDTKEENTTFDELYGGDIYDDTQDLKEDVAELSDDEDVFEFEEGDEAND